MRKKKHNGGAQKRQKHDLCVISMKNQDFVDPARYNATQRHNPTSDFYFYTNELKSSARHDEKKNQEVSVQKMKKMSTSGDITKNVGGPSPPPVLGLNYFFVGHF